MKTYIIATLMFLVSSPACAQDSAYPGSLLEWLKMEDIEGYRTLSATDQNGFYFAVKLRDNGDILFAAYPHEDNNNRIRSCTMIVETVDGTNLQDLISPPRLAPAIRRKFDDGSIFYGPAGFPVRLREHNENKIRVRYLEDADNARPNELFNQVVVLPTKESG